MRQTILLQNSGKSSFHAKYSNHCCCCFICRNFAISVVAVVVVQLTPSLAPSGTWWLMLTLFTIWLFVILTTLMVTSVDCTDCDFWLHAISTQPVCPMQQYPNTQNTLSQIPNSHSQKQKAFGNTKSTGSALDAFSITDSWLASQFGGLHNLPTLGVGGNDVYEDLKQSFYVGSLPRWWLWRLLNLGYIGWLWLWRFSDTSSTGLCLSLWLEHFQWWLWGFWSVLRFRRTKNGILTATGSRF